MNDVYGIVDLGLEPAGDGRRVGVSRRNELFLAGWFPLVTTWKEVTEQPARFIAQAQEAWARVTAAAPAPQP